eukprot:scaffold55567_cov28-Tisochrysis_lutea.AAC.5
MSSACRSAAAAAREVGAITWPRNLSARAAGKSWSTISAAPPDMPRSFEVSSSAAWLVASAAAAVMGT